MKETKKIAICALLTAISVVFCVLSSFFPNLSLTIIAICGVASALALASCGYKYALLMYGAVSVLSLLLSPDKSCALYYVFLFGHYPILKTFLERISNKFFRFVLKLFLANLLGGIVAIILSGFLGVQELFGGKSFITMLLLYNVAFILYDICLWRLVLLFISGRYGKR